VALSLRSSERQGTALLEVIPTEQLVLGESYPYMTTPYAQGVRPQGSMSPQQYPLYPYEGDGVHPLYKEYGQTKNDDWFADNTVRPDHLGHTNPNWATKSWSNLIGFQTAPAERQDEIEGGQYQSPILPDDDEEKAWSFFGDDWQDHTYVPGLKRVQGGQALRQLPPAGVQALHQAWASRGHSNNFQGMTHPVEENNPLGEHVVGNRDRLVRVDDAEGSYGGVVDPALRYVWDAFSGDEPVEFDPPVLGESWDERVKCEDEGDPTLCDGDGFKANPVSPIHTNSKWIKTQPQPEEEEEKEGVLERSNRGVLPKGGGKHIYGGHKGDLITDCTDPDRCHFKPTIRSNGNSYHA